MSITLQKIPEQALLDLARRQGSGDMLKDTLAPFAFFVLLRWVERQEREEQAIALFDERHYEPLLPEHLSWSALIHLEQSELFRVFHEELLPTLSNLHDSPLAYILNTAAYAFDPKKVTELLQYSALRLVAELPFDTVEDLQRVDETFQRIIERFVETTRYAGELITPTHVAHLMLEIASPQPGEKIYDPCFGMGSLLAGAARRVTKSARALAPSQWLNLQSSAFFGIEKSPIPYLVGMTRIILAGVTRPQLALGDTLERDLRSTVEQYDVVLAAPPIGGKVNNRWLLDQFPIRTTSTENLFLQHIMRALKPNGRAIVALPEGILFRTGSEERLREQLLGNFCVEGVISLPAGTLLPYTGVKPNLIIFRRAEPCESIWFQEAEQTGKSPKRAALFDPEFEARRFRERLESETAWLTPAVEIAERNFDLTVKRRDASELEALLYELRERDASVKIVRLEEVVDVLSGIGYTRRDTTKEPTPDSVPLIRVTELAKNGELNPSPLYLTGLALDRARERRLQLGDLLLSTQGTIGKVGHVREAFADSVPAHGITALRFKSSIIQPFYLMRLLQSGPYQQWLAAHASGTTIKNIPVRELRRLLIPLPSLTIQEAIAVNRTAVADSSVLLKFLVSGQSFDEFSSFLLGSEVINEIVTEEFDESHVIERFARLAAELRPWRNKAAHDRLNIGDRGLSMWLLVAAELCSDISDAFELPRGIERLAMLEGLRGKVARLKVRIVSDSSIEKRLEAITRIIEQAVERGCQSIMDHVALSATLEPALINADEPAEIAVRLKNEGSLPLRNLRIIVNSEISGDTQKFLLPGKDVSTSVSLPPHPIGVHSLIIKWNAQRLDGTPEHDEITLDYKVRSAVDAPTSDDLGASPYIIGLAVDSRERPEMFYGREDIISRIQRALHTERSSTVLLLEGVRRSGKTSILKRLLLPEILPDWLPVYCDFQGVTGSHVAAGLEANNIFHFLAREIVTALYRAGYTTNTIGGGIVSSSMDLFEFHEKALVPLRGAFDSGDPFEQLDLQIETSLDVVGPRRVLLILDEFDKIQEGIESHVTSPQVPENIRSLFHKHSRLSGIITGARRIRSLRQNYWGALFGIGLPISVSALDVEAARSLVIKPIEGRLVFAPQARDHVVDLCARQPYLIQVLCERIFDECARIGVRTVTPRLVEAAAKKMVDDNEHFRTLWDYIATPRRRYLTCLINLLAQGPDRVTEEVILERLESEGFVRSDLLDIDDDLNDLREIDVLTLQEHELGGSSYVIQIPLFSHWLTKHIDETIYRRRAMKEA